MPTRRGIPGTRRGSPSDAKGPTKTQTAQQPRERLNNHAVSPTTTRTVWLCWLSQPAEFQPDLDTFPVADRHIIPIHRHTVAFQPQTRVSVPPSSRWFPDPLHLGDESEFAQLCVAHRQTATSTNTASRPSRYRPQKARM